MATKPFLEKNPFQAVFAFKYTFSKRYTLILKVVTITLVLGFTCNIILFLIMLLKKTTRSYSFCYWNTQNYLSFSFIFRNKIHLIETFIQTSGNFIQIIWNRVESPFLSSKSSSQKNSLEKLPFCSNYLLQFSYIHNKWALLSHWHYILRQGWKEK